MDERNRNRILIATVSATAMTVSMAAVYYFGISLPKQQASLLELKRQEQQAQLDLQQKELEARQELDKQQREAELAIEKRKQELEEQKYKDEKAAEEKKLVEQRIAELARLAAQQAAAEEMRRGLEDCLETARVNYSLNWDNACKSTHEASLVGYKACLGRSGKAICDSVWANGLNQPEKDCQLPAEKADSVEEWRKEAIDQCNKQYPIAAIGG